MKIDPKEFVAAVRQLADENPDKVYKLPQVWDENGFVEGTSCLYVEPDLDTGELVGSCLIGRALVNLGVPVEELDINEGMSIQRLNHNIDLGLPDDVAYWAGVAQGIQDANHTWSDAVNGADRDYPWVVA